MANLPLYFGCWERVGHFVYDVTGKLIDRDRDLPEAVRRLGGIAILDRPFCPDIAWKRQPGLAPGLVVPSAQWEGRAALHHREGLTILSLWDRTVDRRHGSHSTFILDGTHDFERAQELAAGAFPSVWARFAAFNITRGRAGEPRELPALE